MTLGAWIMFVAGAIITLGGLSVCIGIALGHQTKRLGEADHTEEAQAER